MSPTPKRQALVECDNCGTLNEATNKYCIGCQMPMSKAVRPSASPFEAIKHTDDRGEYWSARELMPMYGYGEKWQNFAACVGRAMIGAQTNGEDVSRLFTEVSKKTSGRPGQDYRLARHAAYLVAMEGDPSKPEIAAAKHYFATRTREAEIAAENPRIAEGDELDHLEREVERTRKAIAIARAERARADHFEQRADKAEGTIREIEGADGLTLRAFHKKYFSDVRDREFFEHLYAKKYLIDQRGKGGARHDGTVRDGGQHRHPGAKGKPFLYLHFGGIHGDKRREYTRVRPGQHELDFKAALVRDGLKPNDNDDGFLFGIDGGA